MRRGVMLALLVAAALVVASGVALAATKVGTRGNDRLVGTDNNDVLKGKAGNDRLFGKGGDDLLNGGSGRDRLHDDANPDETDSFSCGSGRDAVWANPNDTVPASCEVKNVAGGGGEEAQDLLPDLGMARIGNLQIFENSTTGEKLLRFSTMPVNVGAGSFEVNGERSGTSTVMTTTQRVYDSNGDFRDLSTDATLFYSGVRDNWRVRDVENYELFRLDESGNVGEKVAETSKDGYCFVDGDRYGGSAEPFYLDCAAGNPDALSVTMGFSRGWGDRTPNTGRGQNFDITSLEDGLYRLQTTVDHADYFLEEKDDNNFTYVDLRITGNTVDRVADGPFVQPVS